MDILKYEPQNRLILTLLLNLAHNKKIDIFDSDLYFRIYESKIMNRKKLNSYSQLIKGYEINGFVIQLPGS